MTVSEHKTAEQILYEAGHGVMSRSVALKAMEIYAESQTQQLRTEVAHFIEVNDSNQKVVNRLQEENAKLKDALRGLYEKVYAAGYMSDAAQYYYQPELGRAQELLTPKP